MWLETHFVAPCGSLEKELAMLETKEITIKYVSWYLIVS